MANQMQSRRSLRRWCPCGSRNIELTSNSPGDGRRQWKCVDCGFRWTEGRRPGTGYKEWE